MEGTMEQKPPKQKRKLVGHVRGLPAIFKPQTHYPQNISNIDIAWAHLALTTTTVFPVFSRSIPDKERYLKRDEQVIEHPTDFGFIRVTGCILDVHDAELFYALVAHWTYFKPESNDVWVPFPTLAELMGKERSQNVYDSIKRNIEHLYWASVETLTPGGIHFRARRLVYGYDIDKSRGTVALSATLNPAFTAAEAIEHRNYFDYNLWKSLDKDYAKALFIWATGQKWFRQGQGRWWPVDILVGLCRGYLAELYPVADKRNPRRILLNGFYELKERGVFGPESEFMPGSRNRPPKVFIVRGPAVTKIKRVGVKPPEVAEPKALPMEPARAVPERTVLDENGAWFKGIWEHHFGAPAGKYDKVYNTKAGEFMGAIGQNRAALRQGCKAFENADDYTEENARSRKPPNWDQVHAVIFARYVVPKLREQAENKKVSVKNITPAWLNAGFWAKDFPKALE
jgi:hypothetical protein